MSLLYIHGTWCDGQWSKLAHTYLYGSVSVRRGSTRAEEGLRWMCQKGHVTEHLSVVEDILRRDKGFCGDRIDKVTTGER